jgi:MerR family transcriptional regulator, light-induced transcriptional regulator
VTAPLEGLLRIGSFSRRVGVSTSVLRAWELRYGLFTPLRTPAGYRLYTPADEARARRMLWHLGHGLAARESAELALADAPSTEGAPDTPLVDAWRDFNAAKAHKALDGLLAEPDAPKVVSQSVLPDLARAADEWMREALGPAQVHFASRMLETRLLALGERWHEGRGPLALIGCGPGEQHTLGSIAFALALHARGWRIAYLGADAPLEGFAAAARALAPARVVIAFTMAWTLAGAERGLRGIAAEYPLVLAGPAASAKAANALKAAWLPGDPAAAASLV